MSNADDLDLIARLRATGEEACVRLADALEAYIHMPADFDRALAEALPHLPQRPKNAAEAAQHLRGMALVLLRDR